MPLTVEAVYENGVLKPAQPLPLQEHEKVRIHIDTVPEAVRRVRQSAGLIPCTDQSIIEWAARDPELDYPSPGAVNGAHRTPGARGPHVDSCPG